jgi:hypothetical protein
MNVEDQSSALHKILHAFEIKGLLSDDPYSVCIEQEGGRPIYPCKRSYPSLDLSQVDWAFEYKRFWFGGTIKILWLELDTVKAEIDASKVEVSKWLAVTMAEKRGFTIIFERYAGPEARLEAGKRR